MTNRLRKATAYVTARQQPSALLVFEHPTAGVQLPAGTVEVSESPLTAAVREVREETGVASSEPSILRVEQTAMPPGRRMMVRTANLLVEPYSGARQAGKMRRGLPVEVKDRSGGYILVAYEERDLASGSNVLIKSTVGWVPGRATQDSFERFHIHLWAEMTNRGKWTVRADGHIFKPHWVPLRPRPQLVCGQDEWLAGVYEELLKRVERPSPLR